MSSRGRRISSATLVGRFDWGSSFQPAVQPAAFEVPRERPAEAPKADRAEIERAAYLDGYAQGERSGAEAGAKRAEAMLRRLGETIDELISLRADILHRCEQQVVQLALAISSRIVRREVAIDRTLLIGMARAALDRFGEQMSATVRLHPEDYEAAVGGTEQAEGSPLTIVADQIVPRGSCLVQSDFGFMDVSPDAQFDQLVAAIFEDGPPQAVPAGVLAKDRVVAS